MLRQSISALIVRVAIGVMSAIVVVAVKALS